MAYETLLYEKRGSVAILTLNRPERLNALSRAVWEELSDALDLVERDEEVRVYLVTGAPRPDGRPIFSAGADLKERAGGGGTPPGLASDVVNRIDELLKPSIAVVDGLCTTGGLELALACDLRVASERAQFSDWHLKVTGLGIGAWGMATRLSRLVGLARAKELILTGMTVDAQESLRIGLVNRVFPAEKLVEGALELAGQMAAMRPEGVKVTLAFLDSNLDMQKHQALRWAQQVRKLTGIESKVGQAAREFVQRSSEKQQE